MPNYSNTDAQLFKYACPIIQIRMPNYSNTDAQLFKYARPMTQK